MPAPDDPEFRRRAVELARRREKPIAQMARYLGIAESGLRRYMAQADIDDGHVEGLSSDERKELVELRRKNRVLIAHTQARQLHPPGSVPADLRLLRTVLASNGGGALQVELLMNKRPRTVPLLPEAAQIVAR